PPSTVSVALSFNGINYQYVKGFFGDQINSNLPAQSVAFSAFGNSLTKATVSFTNPQLSFTVSNDYGIPMNVTFNPLEARKNNGSSVIGVQLSPSSPININLPAQLGLSATTNVNITNSKQLIDFVPDQLDYKISAH